MPEKNRVSRGKYYWVNDPNAGRVPMILKVYGIDGQSVEGLVFDTVTSTIVPTRQLKDDADWNAISAGEPVDIQLSHVGDEVDATEISGLQLMARLRVDYFFSGSIDQPLGDFLEAGLAAKLSD